jgi:drug/metabolite transporter (DMT)-like permease
MKSTTLNRHAGILAMAGTAFLWSLAGLFIKVIDWNPITIAGSRSLIASIVIFIFLKRPKITWSAPQIIAAIANSSTMLLFVCANKTTTAANAILLQYFAPIITILIGALFLKEQPKIEHLLAIPLVALGLILMFIDDLSGGHLIGNILALLSAFTFSIYFIFMRKQKDGSPLESVLLSHWLTACIALVASFFLPLPSITIKSIGAIAVLGVVQIGFAAILFSVAIKNVSAVQANLIAVIEPVFNPVWVFLVLGEVPGAKTLVGGIIVIMTVTVSSVINAIREKVDVVKVSSAAD